MGEKKLAPIILVAIIAAVTLSVACFVLYQKGLLNQFIPDSTPPTTPTPSTSDKVGVTTDKQTIGGAKKLK